MGKGLVRLVLALDTLFAQAADGVAAGEEDRFFSGG